MKTEFTLWFLRSYIYLSVALFGYVGYWALVSAFGNGRLLSVPDGLFGISNRAILIVAGAGHGILAASLFVMRGWTGRGLLALWAGFNHLVYRWGMAWLHVAAPFPLLKIISAKIQVDAKQLDSRWKFLIGYLIVGGVLHLAVSLWRRKHLEAEDFAKHWRERREGKPVQHAA